MNICAYAVQAVMYILNTLNGLISVIFIGGGMYIVLAPWGMMSSYFYASGVITILIGVVLAATSLLGSMVAQFWKDNTILKGDIKQGRRMTYTYQIIQTAIVGCEIYGLIAIKYELDHFGNAYSTLKAMRPYVYDYVEHYLATKFNEIYYIISTSCKEAQFNYLWLWLNAHCPASMNQDFCQACQPYIITTCIADSNSCFSYTSTASDYDIGPVCAYSFCRLNVVEYVSNTVIWPACYCLFGLVLISLLSVLVNTFISSLHPHPEDKIHPATEVVVVEGGRGSGGDVEVPPIALIVSSSSPGKVSSVLPFDPPPSSSKSDGSPMSASPVSVVLSSSPPTHYQTQTGRQQPVHTRSPDKRSNGKSEQKKTTEHRGPSSQHPQQPRHGQTSSSSSSSSSNNNHDNYYSNSNNSSSSSSGNNNSSSNNNYYSNSNSSSSSSNKNHESSGHRYGNQNHQSSSKSGTQSNNAQSNPQRHHHHNTHTHNSNKSDISAPTSSRNSHGNPSPTESQLQSGNDAAVPTYYKV